MFFERLFAWLMSVWQAIIGPWLVLLFLFVGGCELPKPSLDGYSSDAMIEELWGRGIENLSELFDGD